MATHDHLSHESMIEPRTREPQQHELFSRFILRQLPIMKSGPEDEAPLPTLH